MRCGECPIGTRPHPRVGVGSVLSKAGALKDTGPWKRPGCPTRCPLVGQKRAVCAPFGGTPEDFSLEDQGPPWFFPSADTPISWPREQ